MRALVDGAGCVAGGGRAAGVCERARNRTPPPAPSPAHTTPPPAVLRLLGGLGVEPPPPSALRLCDPKLLAWLHEPQLVQKQARD